MTATNRNTFRPTLTSLDDRVMLSAVPMELPTLDTAPTVPARERPADESPAIPNADSSTEMMLDEPAYMDAVARWEAAARAVRNRWETARQANWDEYETTMKELQKREGRLLLGHHLAFAENDAKYAPLMKALWTEYAAAGERGDSDEQDRLLKELTTLGEQAREELHDIQMKIAEQLEANLQAQYEASAKWRAKETAIGEEYNEAMEALAANLPKPEDFRRPIHRSSGEPTVTGGSSDLGDIGSVLDGVDVNSGTTPSEPKLESDPSLHKTPITGYVQKNTQVTKGNKHPTGATPLKTSKPANHLTKTGHATQPTPTTPLLNPVAEFFGGIGDNLHGKWDGVVNLITDFPGTLQKTVDGIGTLTADPTGTLGKLWDNFVTSFQKNPARASGDLFAELSTSLIPGAKIASSIKLLQGTEKLGKIGKVLDKVMDTTGGLKKADHLVEKSLKQISKRSVIKEAQLPITGGIRYLPPTNWKPGNGLPTGKLNGRTGYLDKFGNVWVKGGGKGGAPFEWDVQLSQTGKNQLGKWSNSGSHVNVAPNGRVTH
jgi:hypothetical protein